MDGKGCHNHNIIGIRILMGLEAVVGEVLNSCSCRSIQLVGFPWTKNPVGGVDGEVTTSAMFDFSCLNVQLGLLRGYLHVN